MTTVQLTFVSRQYYYNPTDEKYYYWDEKAQKYETVPAVTNTQTPAQTVTPTAETREYLLISKLFDSCYELP